jgi:hypothetical protein
MQRCISRGVAIPVARKDQGRSTANARARSHENEKCAGPVNKTQSVDRVIFTSTVGTIFGDYIDVRQMKD